MRTGAFVAALTGAGLLGGVGGALLVGSSAPPAAPDVPRASPSATDPADEALRREVTDLRARLDEMKAAVDASARETAHLRGEVATQGKAVAATREKVEGLEAAPPARPGAPDERILGGQEGAATALRIAGDRLAGRFRKAAELSGKSEEEKWAAAREALGLSGYQEEELKGALKEKMEGMQEALRAAEAARADGSAAGAPSIRVLRPDVERLRDVRKRYDDRVGAALTADQRTKWREDGYETALGGGGGMATAVIRVVESQDR